ncbi:hypothetical protein VQ048_04735 [Bergeyella sp. RCAD1439]|nr:hypothetical protein [Bergeyella sp. RCAD1439]
MKKMDNLDIDKWKRERIYDVPEGFFDEMQRRVLDRVSHEASSGGAIVPMHSGGRSRFSGYRWWAVAASVVLICALGLWYGIGFRASEEKTMDSSFVALPLEDQGGDWISKRPTVGREEEAEERKEQAAEGDRLEPKREEVMVASAEKNVTVASPKAAAVKGSRESVDQILASLNKAELTEMAKEAEMDVYLDLFN